MTISEHPDLFIPNPSSGEQELWEWYKNISKELESDYLTAYEKKYLYYYYEEAGLLSNWKKNFFRRHYCESFSEASAFLLGGVSRPHIVDLGCGTGSQAIWLALMGARVTGIDMDGEALAIFRKRKAMYERLAGRSLDITLHDISAFDFDYTASGPIDGVYSMFAFNMMQPSCTLVDLIRPALSDRARVAVIDGNNSSWLPRLIPSRRRDVWSPVEFSAQLASVGLVTRKHQGAVSIPPILWRASPGLLKPIDIMMNRSWFFAISHQILAEMQG